MMERLRSKISLSIKGRNINRFIKRLRTNKIDILSLKYKSSNEADIVIYKKDYEVLLKIKSIYEVTELDIFGFIKIRRNIKFSRHLIIITFIALMAFIMVTNLVFNIEVIHSNKELRDLLLTELNEVGVKKYSFKKSYSELNQIKENILNKYKDQIEWLEIEENGTKYTVRVEERTIAEEEDEVSPRNIVAAKDGVIKKVIAEQGDIVKDMNEYVKKGDLIVTGELIFNDEVKGTVAAEGQVFAETWYVTKTTYPFAQYTEDETGETKEVYAIKFLNHTIELSLNPFKTKIVESEEVIVSHSLIPIQIVKQKQKETTVTDQILTIQEAIIEAQKAAEEDITKDFSSEEYIIRRKYLKSTVKESIVEVEMFFAVYEDITDYAEIG